VDDATFRGAFTPAGTGDYSIAAQTIEGVPLRLSVDPGASALSIKVPIDSLMIALSVVEGGKPRKVTELDVAIEPEPGKGKNVRIDFVGTTEGAAGARCAEVKLDGSVKGLEAKLEDVAAKEDGSIAGTLLASFPPPAADAAVTSSEQSMKLVVTARLGDEQKEQTFSVRLRLVSPMDQKLDQRIIIGGAVLGGLLLLLIVLAVFRRRKPEEEEILVPAAVPSSLDISDEVDLEAVARSARPMPPPAAKPKPPPPKPKPAPAGFTDGPTPGTRRPSSRPDRMPATQAGLPSIPPGQDRHKTEIDAFFDGDDAARRPASDDDGESIYVVLESGAHPAVTESSDDETDLDDDDRPLISGRRFARRRLTSDDLPAPTESDRLEAISDDGDDSRIDQQAIPEPRDSLRIDPETGRPRRDSQALRAAARRQQEGDEELQLDFEEMLGSDEEHGIRDEDL